MNALARDWDAKNTDDSKRFSPKWTYNFVNGGKDEGASIESNYYVLSTNGAATWRDFPYSDGTYREWSTDPNVWRNAINYRIDSMGAVDRLNTDTGLNNLKNHLNNGYIMTFTTYVNSWQYTRVGDDLSATADNQYVGEDICYKMNGTYGAHAMTIVGYNDNLWIDYNNNNAVDNGEKGALKIANSWGYWRNRGFVWLSYNAVRNGAIIYNNAYWITAKESYSPKLLAQVAINTAKKNQFSVYLRRNNIPIYNFALSRRGGASGFDGNIVLDYTPLINDINIRADYKIGVLNYEANNNPTVIKSFRLINPQNNETVLSSDTFPINVNQGQEAFSTIQYGNYVPVTGIQLSDGLEELEVGRTLKLTATITPSNAADQTVTWTSNRTQTAKVDNNGLITVVGPGVATIKATTHDGNKTDTCSISVKIPATAITLSNTQAVLKVGQTLQLRTILTPSNATNYQVSWRSSNNQIVRIDSSNVYQTRVRAVATGTAVITAKMANGNKTATCNVIVNTPIAAPTGVSVGNATSTSLTISFNAVTGATGYKVYRARSASGTYSLIASPTTTNYTNSGLSSATTYYYKVSATNAGGESAKSTSASGTTLVAVVSVTGITLDSSSKILSVGQTIQLTSTITPSNATDKTVTWTSNHPEIASVNNTGLVTVVAAGIAVITVTTHDGNKTAICNVSVSIPVSIIAVAAGENHSLMLKPDGTVWACGFNFKGELGDGTTTDRHTPVQVSGLSNVVAIAAARLQSLALKSDGTVWAWGDNDFGELGDGTTTDRHTPVQVSGLSGVTAISAGSKFSLALKSDGTVWTWGNNEDGELGDGTTTNRHTPVQVASLSGVVAIAGGGLHSLAAKADGTVYTWGSNGSSGTLGDGTTTNRSTPVRVSDLSGVVAIAGGINHSLALKADGSVYAWGWGGLTGDGTANTRYTPVHVSGLSGIVAIAGSGAHSLALKSDGTVYTWGDNDFGQIGNGSSIDAYAPVTVSSLSRVVAIAGGKVHSLAVKADGTVMGWGSNWAGELGNGTISNKQYIPVTMIAQQQ